MVLFFYKKIYKLYLLGPILSLLLILACSKDEKLTTERLEYRNDENGIQRLYRAGEDDPVGRWKFARVTENHPNGQKKFEIGFVDGLKHGAFYFWQSNGLTKLTGSFEQGKRCLLYTSPSPRDRQKSRMPSSA